MSEVVKPDLPKLPDSYVSQYRSYKLDTLKAEWNVKMEQDTRHGYIQFDHMHHKPYMVAHTA